MQKLKVGVLGATGMVGRTYVHLLRNHPWFELSHVVASESSAGKSYAEAVEGRWHLKEAVPQAAKDLKVHAINELDAAKENCDFVFSAVDANIAREWEEKYAAADIPVVSNASAHRFTKDVPMLIPEINPNHVDIIPAQRKNRGWKTGFIAVKPNCSIQSYMAPLFALHEKFGVRKVLVTTLQAISGAGFSSFGQLDIYDNVIPFIKDEEEKSEREPLKIMGKISGGEIVPGNDFVVSAHCTRVPVIDGHMACVSVKFESKPSPDEMIAAWKNFKALPQQLKLPMAPEQPIIYNEQPDRPQSRYDRENDKAMAVTVGRLRNCNILDYRFVGLSNNIIRGAAGGGILNAELLKAKGYLGE